jgi:RNA polymerase-binding transcription factor DksA
MTIRIGVLPVDLPVVTNRGDMADQATTGHQLELQIGVVAALKAEEVEASDAAAHKVPGVCVDCGMSITPARLKAIPTAVRCVDCKGQYEVDPRNRRVGFVGSRQRSF